MLTTKKAVEARADSIAIIKGGNSAYKDELFNSESVRPKDSSVFFMVSDIDNRRSAASWRAKYQQMIKCN